MFQGARVLSTRSLYNSKWCVFEELCILRGRVACQIYVPNILSFQQDLMDKRRTFSTIKVYLAAISACHIGFDNTSAGCCPLI